MKEKHSWMTWSSGGGCQFQRSLNYVKASWSRNEKTIGERNRERMSRKRTDKRPEFGESDAANFSKLCGTQFLDSRTLLTSATPKSLCRYVLLCLHAYISLHICHSETKLTSGHKTREWNPPTYSKLCLKSCPTPILTHASSESYWNLFCVLACFDWLAYLSGIQRVAG